MQAPPVSLIDANGRLTAQTISFLSEHAGFDVNNLQQTRYRQIPFRRHAITLYKYVFFDEKCFKKSELEWLILIAHEQFHRNEIGNNFFGAIGWYSGYLFGFMKAGFSYMKNPYEVRAYAFEKEFGERIKAAGSEFFY